MGCTLDTLHMDRTNDDDDAVVVVDNQDGDVPRNDVARQRPRRNAYDDNNRDMVPLDLYYHCYHQR